MKRNFAERQEQESAEGSSPNNSQVDSEGEPIEPGAKRAKMPKKSKYRMRAHINPMGDLTIPTPLNPDYCDWSLHYPQFFGIQNNNDDKMYANTHRFPINYDKKPEEQKVELTPSIVDVGCGYGGLLFDLGKEFPDKLILGMEIRDKVTNFVVEKINSKRINSQYKNYMNIAVLRTNTMKTIHNYFKKESLEKMFFCFADPHFKKVNHRRRIINTQLLNDYAFSLKQGGKLYVVTDVKDLYDWEVLHLEQHPLFERVSDEENKNDPCIKYMSEGTDEAQKVRRNEGSIWNAVFRKRNLITQKEEIDKEIYKIYDSEE